MILGQQQQSRCFPRSDPPPSPWDHTPDASSAHGDGMADLASQISPGFWSPHGGIVRQNDGPIDEACPVVGPRGCRVERHMALDHAVGREFFASTRRPHCARSPQSFVRGSGVRGGEKDRCKKPVGYERRRQGVWPRVGRLPTPLSELERSAPTGVDAPRGDELQWWNPAGPRLNLGPLNLP